jgi:hypothetical protein
MESMKTLERSAPVGVEEPRVRSTALERCFGVDLRSLAAMRVAIGLILLADLWGRAPYLASHYGDRGIVPRSTLTHFSLHALGGSPLLTAGLFGVAAVFAAMLLVGWRTRLATCASWILLVSLHLRNPYVTDGGDRLLALLLFWGMFLPFGARFSIDARLRPAAAPAANLFFSVASLALLLQVAFHYIFSALLKHPGLWLIDGTAVYFALHVDLITRPLGRTLLEYPFLLGLASRGAYLLELLGPFLLFVPVGTRYFRLGIAAAFILFHLFLAACLYLALFPFICIAAWLAFLPGDLWDRLGGLRTRVVGAREAAQPAARDGAAAAPEAAARGARTRSRALDCVAAAFLAFVFYWNIGTIVPALPVPAPVAWTAEQLRLAQRWSMFAAPLRADGWWVVPAVLRDGSEVDLHTGASPVRREKPDDVFAAMFPTARHMKWLTNLWRVEYRPRVANHADWLRWEWDRRHGPSRAVRSLRILYMVEETGPPGRPPLRAELLMYEWSEEAGGRVVSQEENLAELDARRAK